MVVDYQNYQFANAREVGGSLTIGEGWDKATGTRNIFGATWFATDRGTFEVKPEQAILSFYYDVKSDNTQIDLNAKFKTLLDQYTQKINGQSDKPVIITVNDISIELNSYSYLTPSDLKESTINGVDVPNGEYTFWKRGGDFLGLKNLVGQTVSFSVSW